MKVTHRDPLLIALRSAMMDSRPANAVTPAAYLTAALERGKYYVVDSTGKPTHGPFDTGSEAADVMPRNAGSRITRAIPHHRTGRLFLKGQMFQLIFKRHV